jgi:hypothetical protein
LITAERGNGIKKRLSRCSQELEQENRPAGTNSRSDALGEHKLEGLNLNEERVHLGIHGIRWRLRRELSLQLNKLVAQQDGEKILERL